MSNTQVFPPPNTTLGRNPCAANGRTYSGVPQTPLSVPDQDALILEANGWTRIAPADTTANRPVLGAQARGFYYVDTTLSQLIRWDGVTWRNPVSGASV